jgi:hypothetical protein
MLVNKFKSSNQVFHCKATEFKVKTKQKRTSKKNKKTGQRQQRSKEYHNDNEFTWSNLNSDDGPLTTFRGYSGNTLKTFAGNLYGSHKCTEPELRRVVDSEFITDLGGGFTEYPITAIDKLLDQVGYIYTWKDLTALDEHIGSSLLSSCTADDETVSITEVVRNRWSYLLDELQKHATSIIHEYKKEDDAVIIHFDVPVIDSVTRCERQKSTGDEGDELLLEGTYNGEPIKELTEEEYHKSTNWVFYNGRYYDPAFIYERAGGALIKVCPTNPKQALQRERAIKEYGDDLDPLDWLDSGLEDDECLARSDERLNRRDQEKVSKKSHLLAHAVMNSCFNETTNHSQSKKRDRKIQKNRYLEIDLHEVCDITAIGLMGGYPRHTYAFPPHDRDPKSHHYVYRRTVRVIGDVAQLAWVKSFSIQFRDYRDGKWYPYERTFPGNSDVGTEVINKVSIRARYLRLTVMDYERAKEMRVQVYGRSLRPIDAPRNSVVQVSSVQQRQGKNSNERTVRYSLHPSLQRKYSANHCKRYICCAWCFGYEVVPVSVRRINLKEDIRWEEDEAWKCIDDEETSSLFDEYIK